MAAAFREVVYRLTRRGEAEPRQLPLVLTHGLPTILVETRVAHLDATGHVWRILHVLGSPADLAQAEARFQAFRPPFLMEKNTMARTRHRLVLWYKYRAPRGREGFSHTGFAFQTLGADTVITDATRGDELVIRILARAGPALQKFLRRARDAAPPDFDFELVYAGPARSSAEGRLSAEDERTLQTAWDAGFFAVPRRTSLLHLGRLLDASPSAVGYRLRRAQAALVAHHLGH